MRIPGELVQAQSGTMYAVGTVPNPAMVPVPEQHFVVGPGGDLQAVAPAPPNVPVMPTLERLQNRKSEIISHLKTEGLAVGDLPNVGTVSSLDSVLARGPRPRAGPMSNSVSDSFVAARTTNKLDDLAILDDDDDSFIPFDPPLVSKFGPISRNARMKGRNTEPSGNDPG
nr:hypothetical protein BaRGS_013974 [Batillaria attramentaria]